jgi:hypothetical protein
MAGSGLIPSGGGAWNDFARAVGLLAPKPRIRIRGDIPIDAPHIPDPDAPRLPGPDAPRVPEPDAPRVDDPDAPRAVDDAETPWYRDPEMLAAGATALGAVALPFMLGDGGDGNGRAAAVAGDLTEIGDTAALKAEQKPRPSAAFTERQKAYRAAEADRRAFVNRRNMLAGGSDNIIGGPGGNEAFWNNLAMLPEEQYREAVTSMMPMDRNRALVEAQNAQRAAEMAQRAMTAFLANNPGANSETAKAAAAQMLREKNPAQAGASDIASGQHDTPEAIKEFERLAAANDTWGWGVGPDDPGSMASALQKPPYNLDKPTAEAIAYRYMNRRSWFGVSPFGGDDDGEGLGAGPVTSM